MPSPSFASPSSTTKLGAPCLPVLETWDTTTARGGCKYPHEPWVPHVSRFWRRGIPRLPEGDASIPTNPGCPMSPVFGDVGYHDCQRGMQVSPRTLGAPCLPFLETWDTTTARGGCRYRHKPGCPKSPVFGDVGYHDCQRGMPVSPQTWVPHPWRILRRVGSTNLMRVLAELRSL